MVNTAHMADSSDIRGALSNVRAFILYRLAPTVDAKGNPKLDKVPTSPATGYDINPHDPAEWMLPADAQMWADVFNLQSMPQGVTGYGTGVIISENIVLPNGRRLFALDIDKCRDGSVWAPHARAFIDKLAGGGVEVSVSHNGLHVFGTYAGERPAHGTRNKTYNLELYTRLRFIACTGLGAAGDPLKDLTRELHALVEYFPPHDDVDYGDELTTAPVKEWSGPEDDDELLRRAMRSHSGGAVFGGKAAFADLWNATPSVLARVFPPQQHGAYDASAADLALCNHLAFWTGNHGERMLRLLYRSALVRPKWERVGYLHDTIQRACGSQRQWYNDPRSTSTAQAVAPAAAPVATMPATLQPTVTTAGASVALHLPTTLSVSQPIATTPMQIGAAVPTVGLATDERKPEQQTAPFLPYDPNKPIAPGIRPTIGDYLTEAQQVALFDQCVYIQDIHQVMMPQGHTLSSEKFDAEFSGYTFAVKPDGQQPAKRAWDAFVFSEVHAFPKVKGMFFDPRVPSRTIIERDNWTLINSYVPSIIKRKAGDVSPFLTHLYKLLPLGNDAQILLAYFAACVQHAGEKFQWWPLIQGVEGNGKTTLSHLLEYAIGERYTHWPKAAELGSKFNSAFYGKLLICCEDVYISESRGSLWESLKPMITGSRLEIEGKGVDKVTREVCFNGVMNSNHKNAIRKTANDRRVGPFFCAQQSKADLLRDGMTTDYFRALRSWRMGEGREIVADYLMRYEIPDEWNPATDCIVCPETTATREAISAGLGAAEQEVIEAIAQGQAGFRGGWVSSSALDRLLAAIGKGTSIPRNKRREMLDTLGYMPHPGLPDGRATINDTDGTRPYLYVLQTTPGASERNPHIIMGLYQAAQKG